MASEKENTSGAPASSSPADLLSSGKVVAEAAVSVVKEHSVDKVDKGQVAGAAAGILHAASEYGHLEGKPGGQYIEKAETYLHQVHSSSAPAADAKKDDAAAAPKAPEPDTAKEAASEEKPESGGVGDYAKMAEGFLEKQGGEEKSEGGGGGIGAALKMAGGFFK